MANVRAFLKGGIEGKIPHKDVIATLSPLRCGNEKFIQIDTYASLDVMRSGHSKQTLRLSKDAVDELIALAARHFL